MSDFSGIQPAEGARELQAKSAQSAVMRLVRFPPSESNQALIELADYVFSQLY